MTAFERYVSSSLGVLSLSRVTVIPSPAMWISRPASQPTLTARKTILDGEIVCLNKRGRPQFKDLLFRRSDPYFYAFDALMIEDHDLRPERLIDRKQELRRLLSRVPVTSPIKYADHVDGLGSGLFQCVCKLDLEGIVAKEKSAPYVESREETTWVKILNPNYSQREGREELFERDRHKEPVAGWHTCAIACAETKAS
jgi:ATP dependent DNA ligase domain